MKRKTFTLHLQKLGRQRGKVCMQESIFGKVNQFAFSMEFDATNQVTTQQYGQVMMIGRIIGSHQVCIIKLICIDVMKIKYWYQWLLLYPKNFLIDRSTDLDIPLDLVELSEYNATLGHKACHSFGQEQNARFENLYHPR